MDKDQIALGMIETKGLVGAIEAADAPAASRSAAPNALQ